jgi:hypothetical protein
MAVNLFKATVDDCGEAAGLAFRVDSPDIFKVVCKLLLVTDLEDACLKFS